MSYGITFDGKRYDARTQAYGLKGGDRSNIVNLAAGKANDKRTLSRAVERGV